ncbi:helix-turn-helix domain-containing protein [Maricaulis sp.]|uniref:helix-turn-helix domain-containing protein n=1 Tax=Maricaulis sp. TaxID=1486257 RepID=UPI003A93D38A
MISRGQYFAQWRTHRKLTQVAAADLAGISHPVLNRIENGKRKYDANHLASLAKAYRCEPWELIGVDPTSPETSCLKVWHRIHDPERRRLALLVLEAFTDQCEPSEELL